MNPTTQYIRRELSDVKPWTETCGLIRPLIEENHHAAAEVHHLEITDARLHYHERISAYILFILALPFIDLSPVKPAVRAVHEIRPGMTESQVRAVLDRHFPEHGRFKRPAIGPL